MEPTRICTIENCDRRIRARGWCIYHYTRWRNYGHPEGVRVVPTLRERILSSVEKQPDGGCWIWQKSLSVRGGYGALSANGKSLKAHRVSYEEFVGPIPEGATVDHICHMPACVNPDHLRLASWKQNAENRDPESVRSRSGYRGVVRRNSGRYGASVTHKYKRYYVGTYDTAEEAAEAARQARIRLFTHNVEDRRDVS